MAITTSGGFSPLSNIKIDNIQYEDIEIPTHSKIVKKHWNGSEWVETIFVRVDRTGKTEKWLREKYGDPVYQKAWWHTASHLIMTDRVYVHWSIVHE